MSPLPCLAELEDGPPRHHLAPVPHECVEHLPDVEEPRLPIHQRDQIDAEDRFHGGEPIQVVQHHLGVLAASQLDDDAHAILVGFVTQCRYPLDPLLLHELGDLLEQPRLVDLIGKLADDDSLVGSTVGGLEAGPSADVDPPSSRAVRLVDSPAAPLMNPRGGGNPDPA